MFEPLLADLAQLSVTAWLVMLGCVAMLGWYACECVKGERDENEHQGLH